jgi:hypothetical protein
LKLANVSVPPDKVMLPAVAPLSSEITAPASELVIVTSGLELLTRFQLSSTALTMMPLLIAVPAVCVVGVPVLPGVGPVVVPGAAVSPGRSIWSLVTVLLLTVKFELAKPVTVPSVAVIAVVSAFLSVVASVVVETPLPAGNVTEVV